jgi:hypothetical protein
MGRKQISCKLPSGLYDLVQAFGSDGVKLLLKEKQFSRTVNLQTFLRTGECHVGRNNYFKAVNIMQRIRKQQAIDLEELAKRQEKRSKTKGRKKQQQEADSASSTSSDGGSSNIPSSTSAAESDAGSSDNDDGDDDDAGHQQQHQEEINKPTEDDAGSSSSTSAAAAAEDHMDNEMKTKSTQRRDTTNAAFLGAGDESDDNNVEPNIASSPSPTVMEVDQPEEQHASSEEQQSHPLLQAANISAAKIAPTIESISSPESISSKPADDDYKRTAHLRLKGAMLKILAERRDAEAEESSSSDDVSSDDERQAERRLIKQQNIHVRAPFVNFQLAPSDAKALFEEADDIINTAAAAAGSNVDNSFIIVDDEAANESHAESDADEDVYGDRDVVPVPDIVIPEAEIEKRKEFLENFFIAPDVAADADNNEVVAPLIAAAEKKKLQSVLKLEIDARVQAIREMDLTHSKEDQEVTWPNFMRHVVAAVNLTESSSTILLQLLKTSGLLPPTAAKELHETAKGLMKIPEKQMTKARLLYQ